MNLDVSGFRNQSEGMIFRTGGADDELLFRPFPMMGEVHMLYHDTYKMNVLMLVETIIVTFIYFWHFRYLQYAVYIYICIYIYIYIYMYIYIIYIYKLYIYISLQRLAGVPQLTSPGQAPASTSHCRLPISGTGLAALEQSNGPMIPMSMWFHVNLLVGMWIYFVAVKCMWF